MSTFNSNRIGIPYGSFYYGLLDDIRNSVGGYAMIKLLSGKEYDVVTVRRSNDNAEDDFSYRDILTGSFKEWVGSNKAYVVAIKDQTGTNHATQPTADSQPKLAEWNHGTVSGGVSIVDGAMNFDGVDGYVSLGDSVLTNDVTISGWFNFNNYGLATQYLFRNSGTNARFHFATDSSDGGRIIYGWRDDSSGGDRRNSYSVGLNNGQWYHFTVVTSTTQTDKLYINGVLVHTGNGAYSVNQLTGTSTLSNPATEAFSGLIDGVSIFNRALTPQEIAEIYNAGRDSYSPISNGLVAQWSGKDFEGTEASPTTILDTNDQILDGRRVIPKPQYDGTDDTVNIINLYGYNLGYNETVSAWIKPNSASPSQQGIISHRKPTGSVGAFLFRIEDTTGQLRMIRWTGTSSSFQSATSSLTINYGQWNFVSATFTETGVIFNVNGVTETRTLGTGTATGSDQPFEIGRDGASAYFNGSIDQVLIFNRALTPAEIKKIYDRTKRFYK